jgi:hypothetical protein
MYTLKCLVLQGAPYIHDISRLRVKSLVIYVYPACFDLYRSSSGRYIQWHTGTENFVKCVCVCVCVCRVKIQYW